MIHRVRTETHKGLQLGALGVRVLPAFGRQLRRCEIADASATGSQGVCIRDLASPHTARSAARERHGVSSSEAPCSPCSLCDAIQPPCLLDRRR